MAAPATSANTVSSGSPNSSNASTAPMPAALTEAITTASSRVVRGTRGATTSAMNVPSTPAPASTANQ